MTKRNHFTKIVSFLMALVMTLGMFSMTAFAAQSTDTAKVTVGGVVVDDTNAVVDIYKLINVNVNNTSGQPQDPMYTWTDEVATWINDNYPNFIDTTNNNAVTGVFNADTYKNASDFDHSVYPLEDVNAAALAEMYDKMAAAIGQGTLSPEKVVDASADREFTLNMGNYLVLISGGVNVYRPSTVNVVPTYNAGDNTWTVKDATVVIKSTEPSITKKIVENNAEVDETTASIGDTISYKLTADVPAYPENVVNKMYYIGDVLGEGLTLNQGTIAIVGVDKDGNKTAVTATTTFDVANPNANSASGNLSFLLNFDYDTIKDYKTIEVTYTATLNDKAKHGFGTTDANPGNLNTAYLEYANKPYGANDYAEDTAEVKVYTFGMDLTKVDKKDTNTTLEGAEFTLSDANGNVLKFVEENGYYRLATADEQGSETVKSGADGTFGIVGLKDGKYTLTETKAPADYNLPKDPFDITITNEGQGKANGNINGIITQNIENSKGFSLPSTGGMGTVLFTVAGIALIALGAGMIVIIKKRNGKTAE